MKSTPQAAVRERFESKEALVDAILAADMLRPSDDESGEELKARLIKAPNSKLLRLHGQQTKVQTDFGGRDALVDALCKLKFEGRKVEEAWRDRVAGWSNGKLLDLHGSLSKRAKRTANRS